MRVRKTDRTRRRVLRAAVAASLSARALAADEPLRSSPLAARRTLDAVARGRTVQPPGTPPRPAYLGNYADPRFGRRVTRVVDGPGEPVRGREALWGAPSRHIYSKVAAWDCADGLLAIRSAGASKADGSGAPEWLLLDGESFLPRGAIERSFVEFRWWNTRPGRMLMVTGEGLVDHAPMSGEERTLALGERVASDYIDFSLTGEGNLSTDDDVVALLGHSRRDGAPHALVGSLERDELLCTIRLDYPRVDSVSVTPGGRFVVVNGELEPGQTDRTQVFDLAGERVGKPWGPYGTPSHFDLGVDARGRDIAVGVAKSDTPDAPEGSLVARRVEDGAMHALLEGGYAMHTSCRNVALPGWCFVSYVGRFPERYPPFADELVAVRLDGSGEFRRLCQFQHVEADYWAQPQACPDTRGRRAVFASNWREADGVVQAYVVEADGLEP